MLRCPHCHATEPIYRSRFRVWEYLLLLLFHRPYRCYWCQTRFFAIFRTRGVTSGPSVGSAAGMKALGGDWRRPSP